MAWRNSWMNIKILVWVQHCTCTWVFRLATHWGPRRPLPAGIYKKSLAVLGRLRDMYVQLGTSAGYLRNPARPPAGIDNRCPTLKKLGKYTQYRQFKTNIHRKGIAPPRSQLLHSCVCEWYIQYIPTIRSAYSAAGIYVAIYKSLADTW
jgi:hypothetical protein